MAPKTELLNHDWPEVYTEDTNASYDAFLDTFLTLYDEDCPLEEYRQHPKKKWKPWLTKGLEKACT